ncbi:MAG: SMP-30/gluconolactonase/LRE family protein [Pseudomonadota bacterium]
MITSRVVFGSLGLCCFLLAYLLFWPIAAEPVAWDAPQAPGYVGVFEPNDRLSRLEIQSLGAFHGPEDIVAWEEAGALVLYSSTQTGQILKIDPAQQSAEVFTETGGVPLGMEVDARGNLVVADAHAGLLSIAPDGTVSVLTDQAGGLPVVYADDLDIAENGVIYFSDASTKFSAEEAGSTLKASVLEIFEHARTGRILSYDPKTDKTEVVQDGLSFANGVAMGPEDQSIFVAETGKYRILRLFVSGPRNGEIVPVFENLPGFPDNINRGPFLEDGRQTYFFGLAGPRLPLADKLSDKPYWRRVILRLPEFLHPAPKRYGFVAQFAEDGEIIQTWQDPEGAYPTTTGAVLAPDGNLYVTSLEAHGLARLPYAEGE